MSRPPRYCPSGMPVHVIQRGNNKQACFASDGDMKAYAHWLQEGADKYRVDVHGWVFMTNHMHLLLTPAEDTSISRLMQYVGRLYVRRFNFRYSRTGTLFDGRFKSCLVQSERYLLTCLRYIELNPVRAGLVSDPAEYRWSSYRCHAFGLEVAMQSLHPSYLSLGQDAVSRQSEYRKLVSESIDVEVLSKIRHCTNSGLVLGSEMFRKQVRQMRL